MNNILLIGFLIFVVNLIIIRLVERQARLKGNPRVMPFSKDGIQIHAILFLGLITISFGVFLDSFEIMAAGLIISFIGLIPVWIDRLRRVR